MTLEPEALPAAPNSPTTTLAPAAPKGAARGPMSEAGAAGDDDASGFDVRALLRALRRRWLPALLLGVAFAAAGTFAGWRLVPARHTVRALLYVDSNLKNILRDRTQDLRGLRNYQRAQ